MSCYASKLKNKDNNIIFAGKYKVKSRAYFISCGCDVSKDLAGFCGATISEPRLLNVLDLSILREASAGDRSLHKLESNKISII